MLVSMPGPWGHTALRLPSQPNGIIIPPNEVPNYIPIEMRRKVFVVNHHLAVGAAGTALHIRMFISDLFKDFHNRSEFAYAEITTFLDRYASTSRGGEVLGQIGALVLAEATDWRGSLAKGLANHRNITSERFGKVVAIGTGSDTIIDQVHRFDTNYEFGMSQPPDGVARFPEFSTLACNLHLLANVYWKEFTSPDNIFEAWGGAYDLIYQDSNKVFQYLNDYTIFLRLFDMDQTEKGIQLANVLKYERRSDLSFILMLNNGKLEFFGAKDITASDEPVRVRFARGDLTMNSQIHMSIIAVGKGNRFLAPLIQIDGLDPAEQGHQTAYTQFDEDGRLLVLFHAEHDEWLEGRATSYYKRNAHRLSSRA